MKRKIFYCAAVSLVLLITGCEKKDASPGQSPPPSPKAAKAQLSLTGTAPTLDSSIHRFFNCLAASDTACLLAGVLSTKEYAAIYPHLPNADPNPNSPGFIAGLFTAGNRKQLRRWLYDFQTKNLKFKRYTVEKDPEKHPAFTYIKGIRLFVTDSAGNEKEFPVFRTVIQIQGGYKIWSILET